MQSTIWFSYRSDIVKFDIKDDVTTDSGWGCMLRCGQMLLAEALKRDKFEKY